MDGILVNDMQPIISKSFVCPFSRHLNYLLTMASEYAGPWDWSNSQNDSTVSERKDRVVNMVSIPIIGISFSTFSNHIEAKVLPSSC